MEWDSYSRTEGVSFNPEHQIKLYVIYNCDYIYTCEYLENSLIYNCDYILTCEYSKNSNLVKINKVT